MSEIMKCKCGEELIFNDNSISEIGCQCYPLYYCYKCNKVWNAYALEDEENPEYIEETDKIYKKWFTKDVFIKIKNWHINHFNREMKAIEDIINRLN
jgi:hypothetical protein